MVAHWDWVLYNFRLPVARALRERGCLVTFVCPFGEYTGRLQESGFECVPWHIKRRSLNPLWEVLALLQLMRIFRRLRPDVAHHFTIKPNLYGTIAARWAGTPVIINTFTGLGYVFSTSRRARFLQALLRPLLRWGLRSSNTTAIFQNSGDLQTMVDMGVLPLEQTVIIPGSGVDVQRFRPRNKGLAPSGPSSPVVFLASRLLWDKGVQEFIEAARIVKAQGADCRFWVAGAPDSGNPRCIPAEVLQGWRNEGCVKFLGHRQDIPDLLARADIAVFPTSYQEGVPKFLIEAAAAALPLVATNIEGCRTVVREGVNGFLVPPKDSRALAAAILRLLADPALRSRLGEASREMAVEEFAEERIIGQYLELYFRTGALTSTYPGPARE